jgi:hypothetical protein
LQAVGQLAHRRLAVGLDLQEVDDFFDRLAVPDLLALGRADAQRLQQQVAFDLAGCGPVMMLSSTLMPLNSARFWKVRAMPISATCRLFMCLKVWPRKVMVPCCGW